MMRVFENNKKKLITKKNIHFSSETYWKLFLFFSDTSTFARFGARLLPERRGQSATGMPLSASESDFLFAMREKKKEKDDRHS